MALGSPWLRPVTWTASHAASDVGQFTDTAAAGSDMRVNWSPRTGSPWFANSTTTLTDPPATACALSMHQGCDSALNFDPDRRPIVTTGRAREISIDGAGWLISAGSIFDADTWPDPRRFTRRAPERLCRLRSSGCMLAAIFPRPGTPAGSTTWGKGVLLLRANGVLSMWRPDV